MAKDRARETVCARILPGGFRTGRRTSSFSSCLDEGRWTSLSPEIRTILNSGQRKGQRVMRASEVRIQDRKLSGAGKPSKDRTDES